MKTAPPATPPSHLRARGSPTTGPEKIGRATTPHPRRLRLRALIACGGRRFSRPLGRSRSTVLKGRRVLRSTAPENIPKTPENSLKSEFSTVWTNSFHCVEKRRIVFPLCGKNRPYFSIAWKIPELFFHCVWKTWRDTLVRIAYEMNLGEAGEAACSWFSART